MAEEKSVNGGQEDIYSFKTDSPMGSDSSDPDGKVNQTPMGSVKYKRKLWRNSTDDEDEVPCIKPCIVLLQRSKLCEAAWQKEKETIEHTRDSLPEQNGCLVPSVPHPPVPTHSKSGLSDSDFKCHVCQEKFSGRNLFMHHMRSKHGNNSNNNVRQSTPPPPPKGEFLRFFRHKGTWKMDTRNLDCEVCGKALPSPYKLKAHLEVEHGRTLFMGGPEGPEQFSCPQCHKECESKLDLDRHVLTRHPPNENNPTHSSQPAQRTTNGDKNVKVYECPYCFTLHANKDRFKKHLGFVSYPYSECMVTVDNNSMARQKDPVYCEVCGSKAANQAFLHAHQTSHAELPRPHECSETDCKKHFVFQCQLDRHMLLHHQKNSAPPVVEPVAPELKVKGKFRCQMCNKRSRTKGKLDTHMQTCHKVDSQDYRCDICNICLPSTKQLSSHYAKKHEGVPRPAALAPEEPKENDVWTLPDATFAPFPTATVRPESIGSSDSVSASDAFSMYFQSLQSLNLMDMDIPLDLEGNVTNNNEKILNPLDGSHREIIHQPANLAEFNKSSKESELEFHTLQTVQNPEPSTTLLQNLPALAEDLPIMAPPEELIVPALCSLEAAAPEVPVNNFILSTPPVVANPQACILTFDAAQTIQATADPVLPIFPTQELKYDPKLDFAIKQELEKNTKELQEMCDSTNIGFIPIPESAVVATAAASIVTPQVLSIAPTANNLDQIVQEIMMPTAVTQPPLAPAAEVKPEPTTEEIKRKLAAKTKKKKQIEETPVVPQPVQEPPTPAPEESGPKKDCKLCGKFFSSHEMLIKHCQQNCSGRNQTGADTTCQLCGEKFSDRKLYLKHKKEEHPDSLLTCNACDKTFFLMQSLARHQKQTCTKRIEYNCRKCKAQHDSIESLRSHMQSVHPENVVCHICSKVLATSQSLKRHIRNHNSKGDGTAGDGGDTNPDSPPSKFDLSETMDSSDGSLKKLSLNQIDVSEELSLNDLASWGNSTDLVDHINMDGGSNFEEELMLFSSDTLTCEFCGSTFGTNKLLRQHLSSQHFPNTHWQPQTSGAGTPIEDADLAGHSLTSVSCNDS